jgi:hypothetical protein
MGGMILAFWDTACIGRKINERRYMFFSLEHLTTIGFEATRMLFWY